MSSEAQYISRQSSEKGSHTSQGSQLVIGVTQISGLMVNNEADVRLNIIADVCLLFRMTPIPVSIAASVIQQMVLLNKDAMSVLAKEKRDY